MVILGSFDLIQVMKTSECECHLEEWFLYGEHIQRFRNSRIMPINPPTVPPTVRWRCVWRSQPDLSPTRLPGECPAPETSSRQPGSRRSDSSGTATTHPLPAPDTRRPAAARTPPAAATTPTPPSPRSASSTHPS